MLQENRSPKHAGIQTSQENKHQTETTHQTYKHVFTVSTNIQRKSKNQHASLWH